MDSGQIIREPLMENESSVTGQQRILSIVLFVVLSATTMMEI